MNIGKNDRELTETKARYDRIAPVYDLMEGLIEKIAFRGWRKKLMAKVQGEKVLEIGVGTGKNLLYYPNNISLTGIDISRNMLARAGRRAEKFQIPVELLEMDAENLQFPDDSFDTTLATFVFCSVSDPIKGLREIGRVTRVNGRILLLEHMRPNNELLGRIFDLANPLVLRIMGPNINRRTLENVERAGLEVLNVEDLTSFGIVKLIEVQPAP